MHTKLWGPKGVEVPTLAISGLSLGSLRTKNHLDVGLVERHKKENPKKGREAIAPSFIKKI
jgi:hypothetical protein